MYNNKTNNGKETLMNVGQDFGFVVNSKNYADYESMGQQLEITAVRKDGSEIALYKLSDGSVVSKATAVGLAHRDLLKGVILAQREGEEYIKTIPDGESGNNLSELPEF